MNTNVTIDGKEYTLIQHEKDGLNYGKSSMPRGIKKTDWVYYKYYRREGYKNPESYWEGQAYAHQVSWYHTKQYAIIRPACIDPTWVRHDGGMRPVHPETVVDVCHWYQPQESDPEIPQPRDFRFDLRAKEIGWEVSNLAYRIVSEYVGDKQAKEIEALKSEIATMRGAILELFSAVIVLNSKLSKNNG